MTTEQEIAFIQEQIVKAHDLLASHGWVRSGNLSPDDFIIKGCQVTGIYTSQARLAEVKHCYAIITDDVPDPKIGNVRVARIDLSAEWAISPRTDSEPIQQYVVNNGTFSLVGIPTGASIRMLDRARAEAPILG
jgi:hypothetical protein